MTYTQFVKDYIEKQDYGEPIFAEDVASSLATAFGLEQKKASAAVAVAIKRVMDDQKITGLRRYRKGIFFRTRNTAFGEIMIRKGKIIDRKYISPDKGYETGAGLFYRMGLTTHIPSRRMLATNAAHGGTRYDRDLDVAICPAKAYVTAENKGYLRVLDVLYQMDSIPYDAENPYGIVAEYIERSNLRYDMLLSYADRYYNQKTVLRLAHVAARKEI